MKTKVMSVTRYNSQNISTKLKVYDEAGRLATKGYVWIKDGKVVRYLPNAEVI